MVMLARPKDHSLLHSYQYGMSSIIVVVIVVYSIKYYSIVVDIIVLRVLA
jgi:hypothetical protein